MRRPNLESRTAFWTLLLCACAAIRIGAIASGWGALAQDPDAYRVLAATWHDTGTYGRIADDGIAQPTAYRPPLYPWFLSWSSSAAAGGSERYWIATLHVAFGLATCLLTAQLGIELGLSRRMAALAAVLVAVDPILIRQSMLVMTETLATLLSVLLWWLWLCIRRRAANAELQHRRPSSVWHDLSLGVLMGLSVLCRPTALAWLALWLVTLFRKTKWQTLIACALGIGVVLVPWVVRNSIVLGTPILTTTHGGYTLYLANNPVLFKHWERSVSREWPEDAFHSKWREERLQVAGMGEVEQDRFAQRLALQSIWQNPKMFAWGCVVRFGWFWAIWPSQRQASIEAQVGIGVWYAGLYLLAAWGAWHWLRDRVSLAEDGNRRDGCWDPWIPGILLIFSLTLVHSVYWSNMRMRAPAIPVLCLLACAVLDDWLGKKRLNRDVT